MTLAKLIPLFTALPLVGAFFIAIFGRKRDVVSEVIALTFSVSLFALALATLVNTYLHGPIFHYLGGWKPPIGILMMADGLSSFMLVLVNGVASCIALYSVSYIKKYTSSWIYYVHFFVILAGMNGVLVTGDLFNMFVFMEIASLAACTLVAFGTRRHELEAAFKYGVMNTVGALFIILAIAFVYSLTSSLNMADIAAVLSQRKGGENILVLATVFFILGFGLKSAMAPFHAWLPDAHPSAPAPISALLSGLIIKTLGIYSLFRILYCVLGISPALSAVLLFLGALSMGVGAFLAVGQTDFKRLLAYSSLSQIGFIVFGLGLGTPLGFLAGVLHIFNHSIGKSLLFLTAGAVEYATGTRNLDEMGGLGKKMPVTSVTNFIGAMSLSGIPPFGGFWSKLLIIIAAVQAGRWGYAAFAVLAGILTLAYLMKASSRAFRGAIPEKWSTLKEVPFPMQITMVILAVLATAGGLLLVPGVREFFVGQATLVLLNGTAYANLLGGL